MPGKMTTDGIGELEKKLQEMEDETAHNIAARALYEGAGVMADAIDKAVQGIVTEPFRYAAGGQKRFPSPEEKAILEQADKGVAKFRDDGGTIETSVGLQSSGYGNLAGRRKPVPLIANAINSGTSFMSRQPFYRRAESQTKGPALSRIEEKLREEINKLSID